MKPVLDDKEMILFGAGTLTKAYLKLYGGKQVRYLCDNYKSGQIIMGKCVISYEDLKRIYTSYTIVLFVEQSQSRFEISQQLCADGIPFIYFEELGEHHIRREVETYKQLNTRATFSYDSTKDFFCFRDRLQSAGTINFELWHDLWAFKHILTERPSMHYDIGSRVDGIVSFLSATNQKVTLLDIRPLECKLPNVEFWRCDATNLDGIEDNSIESLSSLYTLHHFGLGRYGDSIDPEACFKCFEAIQRKVKSGGHVYISVLIGKEHLEFNAHRVFYASTIKDCFSQMKLIEFSTSYKNGIEQCTDLHKYDDWDTTWKDVGIGRFGLFLFQKN